MLRQAARTPALHLGGTSREGTAKIQRYIATSHSVYDTYPFHSSRLELGPRLRARKDFLLSGSDLDNGVPGDGEKEQGKRPNENEVVEREEDGGKSPLFYSMLLF